MQARAKPPFRLWVALLLALSANGPGCVGGSSSRSGSTLIHVLGGNTFVGCNDATDSECDADEKPGHLTKVGSFWIDRTEVTVAQYRQCVGAGRCTAPRTDPGCNWIEPGREQHPINCVRLTDAEHYCGWTWERLPTEAEWERSARGDDRRRFPWGDGSPLEAGQVANLADESTARAKPGLEFVKGYDDGYPATAPVGSFPLGASPYGVLDMAGNVWEWCARRAHASEPGVVRGGSWAGLPYRARASNRLAYSDGESDTDVGFRCAR